MADDTEEVEATEELPLDVVALINETVKVSGERLSKLIGVAKKCFTISMNDEDEEEFISHELSREHCVKENKLFMSVSDITAMEELADQIKAGGFSGSEKDADDVVKIVDGFEKTLKTLRTAYDDARMDELLASCGVILP